MTREKMEDELYDLDPNVMFPQDVFRKHLDECGNYVEACMRTIMGEMYEGEFDEQEDEPMDPSDLWKCHHIDEVYGSPDKAEAAEGYEDTVLTITQKIAMAGAASIIMMLNDSMEQMTDMEKMEALYLLRENLNSLFSD